MDKKEKFILSSRSQVFEDCHVSRSFVSLAEFVRQSARAAQETQSKFTHRFISSLFDQTHSVHLLTRTSDCFQMIIDCGSFVDKRLSHKKAAKEHVTCTIWFPAFIYHSG